MATSWKVPTTDYLQTVMSGIILDAVEDTDGEDNSADDQAAKMTYALEQAVARVRGAIGNGNRTPLSATAGSVPPEGLNFTLVLAVEILVNSQPNMNWAIKDGFSDSLKEAKDWIQQLRDSEPTDYPTDPITVDASGFAVADGGNAGDVQGEVDMTTDSLTTLPIVPTLPIGAATYSGYLNPNGNQVANVGDVYNQYSTDGQLINIWQKAGTSGNNVNWNILPA